MVEPRLLIHDASFADLSLFNVMDVGVEVDHLMIHLIEFGTEVGGELLEQFLHGGGVEGHRCPKDQCGLRIPGVRAPHRGGGAGRSRQCGGAGQRHWWLV